jgi:glucosamine-6-phosphate deaminase
MNTNAQPRTLKDVARPTTAVYGSRSDAGRAAADAGADAMREAIARKGTVNVVFASAPSQEEVLGGLAGASGIDWSRVTAFHLDEYIGLPHDAPQAFGQFLRDRLFGRVRPGMVHFLDGNAPEPEAECRRYEQLLREHPLDVAFIGIGENGHIAFNDPHVADFNDPAAVKIVELDQTSREQQAHDGCFPSVDLVPHRALTLTIPAIVAAPVVLCTVPGPLKARAVRDALRGPVRESCPASILRRHANAVLFLDRDSASLL